MTLNMKLKRRKKKQKEN